MKYGWCLREQSRRPPAEKSAVRPAASYTRRACSLLRGPRYGCNLLAWSYARLVCGFVVGGGNCEAKRRRSRNTDARQEYEYSRAWPDHRAQAAAFYRSCPRYPAPPYSPASGNDPRWAG